MNNINIIDETHPAYNEFENSLVLTVKQFNPFAVGTLLKLNILFFLPQAEDDNVAIDFPLSIVETLNNSNGLVGIVVSVDEDGKTLILMENGKLIPINYKNVLALEIKYIPYSIQWDYFYEDFQTLSIDFKNQTFDKFWELIKDHGFERQSAADSLILKLAN